jgi:hypothetical protein
VLKLPRHYTVCGACSIIFERAKNTKVIAFDWPTIMIDPNGGYLNGFSLYTQHLLHNNVFRVLNYICHIQIMGLTPHPQTTNTGLHTLGGRAGKHHHTWTIFVIGVKSITFKL